MPLILGTNSIKDTGYNVANSCRFEAAYLKRTVTPSTSSTWTLSFWLKLSGHNGSSEGYLFSYGSDGGQGLYIRNNGFLGYYGASGYTSDNTLSTGQLRDPSAWYHIVFSVNSGTGTLYINGVQDTQISNVAPLNATTGNTYGVNSYINYEDNFDNFLGYLTEYVFIDGTAYNQNSFGEFDSDSPRIWKPIDVSGLTFGTNGFYLDFEDSSDLGKDVSGNNNDFTAVRLAATDQTTDTCTNNFATLNPLGFKGTIPTFSEGNLNVVVGNTASLWSVPTIGVSSGKWYVEGRLEGSTIASGIYYHDIGFADRPDNAGQSLYASDARVFWKSSWDGKINYRTGGSTTAGLVTGLTTIVPGNFFQLYLDMDNELMYWGREGSLLNSTGVSFNGKESLTGEYYFAFADQYTNGTTEYAVNFGGGSFVGSNYGATAVSNFQDANGFGNFKYNPTVTTDEGSKDFLALCTKNLAEHG
jgi:hypothetical protein